MATRNIIRPAHVVEIETPKGVLLDGLWFGPQKARTVIILVHGLGGALWRRIRLVESLVSKDTAVLVFNNRGHDRISRIVRTGEKQIGKTSWAGGASEVFTECIDDIEGAVTLARCNGAKIIFLAGHSTGSQKIVYYAAKKLSPLVKGLVLMVPLSDYSVALRDDEQGRLARATKIARALVRAGKPHELLPQSVWPAIDDAQRFLSLYTPDGLEEMFTYVQPKKTSRLFRSVRLPMLAIFAGADEFADRSAQEIADWFKSNNRSRRFQSFIVPGVGHGFRGGEAVVAKAVHEFILAS